jgi:glycosyltransferase involved in cell wall biosynthesis
MRLRVVIPTYGRPDLLGRTLASLAACRRPGSYFETLVIENGGCWGAERIVEKAPAALRARYVYFEIGNKSAALNHVIKTMDDSDFLFFTDDDVRFDPGLLIAYENAAAARGRGHFFGGPTQVDYEKLPEPHVIRFLPYSARGWSLDAGQDEIRTPDFLGFNWAAFATDVLSVGGFDPDRGPGSPTGSTGQESDMQRRLLHHKARGIYVPEATVWHFVPRTRCSAEWVLERSRRAGIERGIERALRSSARYVRPGGMPVHQLKVALNSVLARAHPIERQRFRALQWLSYEGGVDHGFRMQSSSAREERTSLCPSI